MKNPSYNALMTADKAAVAEFYGELDNASESDNRFALRAAAAVDAFTLPCGDVDLHTLGNYLTEVTNDLFPADDCKVVDKVTPRKKLAFDAYLKPYYRIKSDPALYGGLYQIKVARATKDRPRSVTISYTGLATLDAIAAAETKAKEEETERQERINADAEKQRLVDILALPDRTCAETVLQYIADTFPGKDPMGIVAECRLLLQGMTQQHTNNSTRSVVPTSMELAMVAAAKDRKAS